MTVTLRERIAIYRMNTGTGWALWNLFIIGYVGWLVLRTADPFLKVIAGVILFSALITGWLILPISRLHFRLATRLISLAQWTAIAGIIVGWFNILPVPILAYLGILALMMWALSASFWITSSPGVLTTTGIKNYHKKFAQVHDHDPDPTPH